MGILLDNKKKKILLNFNSIHFYKILNIKHLLYGGVFFIFFVYLFSHDKIK